MDNGAIHRVMADKQGGPSGSRFSRKGQETPLEPKKLLHRLVTGLRPITTGVNVRRRTGTEFARTRDRVDRKILPVTVAARDHEVPLRTQKAA